MSDVRFTLLMVAVLIVCLVLFFGVVPLLHPYASEAFQGTRGGP